MHSIGVEPITLGSEDRCSIQLSYECFSLNCTRRGSSRHSVQIVADHGQRPSFDSLYTGIYNGIVPVKNRSGQPVSRVFPSAFSLVEVLVVIGMTGLLMGMLLPALAGARRASKQMVCLSNLRRWGEAFHFYVNSHNGYLPRRGQGVQPTNQIDRPQDWFNAVPPTVAMKSYSEMVADNSLPRPGNSSSIWICPEAVDADWKYYWSYGMNMALSVEQANQNHGMPDKLTGVGSPSVLVLMTDAPGNYCSVYPSAIPNGYNPVARHNGQVNICFLDGHAVSMSAAYVGIGTGVVEHADIRWRPPRSTWSTPR